MLFKTAVALNRYGISQVVYLSHMKFNQLGEVTLARADLMKRLLVSYQRRDDQSFRTAASELIEEERKKHHIVLANELEGILKNNWVETGNGKGNLSNSLALYDPPPMDNERKVALLEIKRPKLYLDDLILEDKTLNLLDRIMLEFREWDVLQSNGLIPTKKILFCGPSGCGKTATAEALAATLSLPLIYVRFDAVVSSLLGETSANLRKVFDYVRRGQWVIFFDEFDSIGRSRDDATEHGELKRVVNSYLQILDNFDGRSLVIAATNFEQALDPAVWRRFDEVIRFNKPGEKQLYQLVKKRLIPLQYKEDLLKELVYTLSDSSYADAERVCLDIRKQCVLGNDRQIKTLYINQALERYNYRRGILDKISVASQQSPTIDKE